MSKVALVVNSCDSHSDVWPAFFELLEKMWGNLDIPIILNSESKSYGGTKWEIENPLIYEDMTGKTWSMRFKHLLKMIEADYVIVLLEDFLLESPVDVEELERCIRFINQNKEIACISFKGKQDNGKTEFPGYRLMHKGEPYRVSCQAALWRKEYLYRILRDHEDAWQFEVFGSKRSDRYPWKFYSAKGEKVFDYDWGNPVYRGFWNIESVKRIEEKTGIKIDTTWRHTINTKSELPPQKKRNIFWRILNRIKSCV